MPKISENPGFLVGAQGEKQGKGETARREETILGPINGIVEAVCLPSEFLASHVYSCIFRSRVESVLRLVFVRGLWGSVKVEFFQTCGCLADKPSDLFKLIYRPPMYAYGSLQSTCSRNRLQDRRPI